MKTIDKILQSMRIEQAKKHIKPGAYVLDVGCYDGVLIQKLAGHIAGGIGIDPLLPQPIQGANYQLFPGRFPEDLPAHESTFDAIVALAVLEHIPRQSQDLFVSACWKALKPGGVVIITVPSPFVDRILSVLLTFHLIDGMSLEEHYGFEPAMVPAIFGTGFKLVTAQRFQLGLNYCFVLQRI
jgi:2-polyprenyl-3-methyl-5-hydroxy-6-metoxy-1,4-benzoquinol methylase